MKIYCYLVRTDGTHTGRWVEIKYGKYTVYSLLVLAWSRAVRREACAFSTGKKSKYLVVARFGRFVDIEALKSRGAEETHGASERRGGRSGGEAKQQHRSLETVSAAAAAAAVVHAKKH